MVGALEELSANYVCYATLEFRYPSNPLYFKIDGLVLPWYLFSMEMIRYEFCRLSTQMAIQTDRSMMLKMLPSKPKVAILGHACEDIADVVVFYRLSFVECVFGCEHDVALLKSWVR